MPSKKSIQEPSSKEAKGPALPSKRWTAEESELANLPSDIQDLQISALSLAARLTLSSAIQDVIESDPESTPRLRAVLNSL